MKKLIVAILALLYVSTSTGATLHMHYCMGKLIDLGLTHNTSNTCGKCGMKKSDNENTGCCRDEHRFIKNITDHKATETGIQVIQAMAASFPVSCIEISAGKASSAIEKKPAGNASPRSSGIAVYIRNCIFRI